MNPESTSSPRILVVLDPSPPGLAALEAAARWAAETQGELRGLFVEDINLLRSAGLPCTREVRFTTSSSHKMDVASVERTLQAKAEAVRRAIEDTANRVQIRWSFTVMRGHVTDASLSQSVDFDLLLVGWEDTAQQLARRRRRAVPGPVIVVDDGSEAAGRSVTMAEQLCRQQETDLVLVRTSAFTEPAPRPTHVTARVQRTPGLRLSQLPQVATSTAAHLVLLYRGHPELDRSTLEWLVRRLPCPLGLTP